MWQELFESLQKVVPPGCEPLPKPRPEDLDAYESQTGFRLPESYRQFCLLFGPGAIDNYFNIGVPGYPNDQRADLSAFHRCYVAGKTIEELSFRYDDPVRILRMIFFSDSFDADAFGWDPEEVTSPENHEYAIYLRRRDEPEISKVASTFRDFIVDYCLSAEYGIREHTYNLVPKRPL